MSMQTTVPVMSRMKDEDLAFIREMGVEHVELNIKEDEIDVGHLNEVRERFAQYGLTPVLLSCNALQKNKIIDLGLEGKDEEIRKFNEFVKVAAEAGYHTVSVAWQPNGIHRSGRAVRPQTRGGVSAYFDAADGSIDEIKNDRVYTVDEIWKNFEYFLEGVGPTMQACGVRMALHPNDPPVEYVCGVGSLIYRSDDYRRAFKLDKWNCVGVKLCIGCWLEGGEQFGDVIKDIEEFVAADKVVSVHFRNVSGTVPYFEETLDEDGYANMYEIMKTLVRSGYKGPISVDHAFKGYESFGGMLGAFAYPTGHMKGMERAAEIELGLRNR